MIDATLGLPLTAIGRVGPLRLLLQQLLQDLHAPPGHGADGLHARQHANGHAHLVALRLRLGVVLAVVQQVEHEDGGGGGGVIRDGPQVLRGQARAAVELAQDDVGGVEAGRFGRVDLGAGVAAEAGEKGAVDDEDLVVGGDEDVVALERDVGGQVAVGLDGGVGAQKGGEGV